MKWLWLLGIFGCYAPTIAENVPCGPLGECPTDQRCYAGTCRSSAPDVDAPTIDAALDASPDARFSCGGADSILSSPCVETFSGQGLYFDLEAKQTIGITGFSTMSQNGGTKAMVIYHRPGTHVGFENNAAGWTLAGMATFSPPDNASCPIEPRLIPTSFCIEVPQGQRVAFYIAITNGAGSIESYNKPLGDLVVENAQIKLYAGRLQGGAGMFTGAIVDGKAFQGVVHTSR